MRFDIITHQNDKWFGIGWSKGIDYDPYRFIIVLAFYKWSFEISWD